jgi:hypothetical protein
MFWNVHRRERRKKKNLRVKGEENDSTIYLIDVSSERKPESSSSEGALLAFREDCLEPVRELVREASREAALRETVLPLSKIWRRKSGMMKYDGIFLCFLEEENKKGKPKSSRRKLEK